LIKVVYVHKQPIFICLAKFIVFPVFIDLCVYTSQDAETGAGAGAGAGAGVGVGVGVGRTDGQTTGDPFEV
jgi:hypothetical protein